MFVILVTETGSDVEIELCRVETTPRRSLQQRATRSSGSAPRFPATAGYASRK
jgi:hypothetical protein